MTVAATALALYLRTRALLHHLTNSTAPADHNHPPRPVILAFPLHEPRASPRRRRHRHALTTAVRRLLKTHLPPPPRPARIPSAAAKPPCRLCAAVVTQPGPTGSRLG